MNLPDVSEKKLSLWQVTLIGIAYMTPMVVFDTFGLVSEATNGRVPLAYLLALTAMLLTAFSYARFSAISPNSGSAYSYTADACGQSLGFFVGWCALLDYMLLPLVNALLVGIYAEALIPSVPSWLWIIITVGFVTIINSFRINFLANLSLLFVVAPVILMIVFIYLVVSGISMTQGAEYVLTTKPLFNGDTTITTLIAGASILCFSFLGFDAITTLSHETENPQRTIPRAVLLTTLMGGLIFFTASWFIQLYFPTNAQFKEPSAALPEIVLYVGGALFQAIFLTGQIMNTLASGLASHASAARLLHIMGRDGIFSRLFGVVNAKLGTPLYAVIFVGLVSLIAVFLDLAQVVSLISFGALIAFTSVNFSVFMRFYVKEKQNNGFKHVFLNAILPLLSVLTIVVLWLNLEKSSLIFGVQWLTVGIAFFIYKKVRKQSIVMTDAY